MAVDNCTEATKLKDVCTKIRDLIPKLLDVSKLNAKESKGNSVEIKEKFTDLRLMLSDMKTYSQRAYASSNEAIQKVKTQKKLVEQHYLKLQNLLYEKNHFLNEIARCRGFVTKELNKIEFENTQTPISVDPASHKSHLEELTSEMEKRKKSQNELKEIKSKIIAMDATVVSKENFLDGIPPQLGVIEEATKALQKYLGNTITEKLEMQKEAKEDLPLPLYTLYCELEAYIIAFDAPMKLSVIDAKRFLMKPFTIKKRKMEALTSGNAEEGNERPTKNSRGPSPSPSAPRKSPSPSPNRIDSNDSKLKMNVEDDKVEDDAGSDGLSPSLKGICLEITTQYSEKEITLTIFFQYLPTLDVVTVETVGYDDLLINLFPGDNGVSLPNLSSNYKLSGDENQEIEYPQDASGRPYYWAQWICGKYEMMRDAPIRPEPSIRAVLSQIQKRFLAHVCLKKQISCLIKNPSQLEIHESAKSLFVQDVSTCLDSWNEMDAKVCCHYFDKDQIHSSIDPFSTGSKHGFRYFKASFKTDKVKIISFVEISPEYPVRPPKFLFQSKHSEKDSPVDNQLRDIEREVNGYYEELMPEGSENQILSHQIRKIQMCFDIIQTAGPISAVFGRDRRGKDRRRAIVVDVASNQCKHR